jgi:hypothetical protein
MSVWLIIVKEKVAYIKNQNKYVIVNKQSYNFNTLKAT